MKKIGAILFTVCIISLSFSFQAANAQDKKPKEDKEKDLQMEEEIDAQKKAISEQKRAMEESQNEMEFSKKSMEEAMRMAKMQLDSSRHFEKYFKNFNEDLVAPYINGVPFHFGQGNEHFMIYDNGDGEKTSWDFAKTIKENSYSGDYTFDVEPTATNVVMSVNGDCKKGEIRIKIAMPNGKTYSDILIDEFGNLNWRKSFNISDTENKDKTGEWKFHISATKATGFFRISLQTF
jgi:hypothetical protein